MLWLWVRAYAQLVYEDIDSFLRSFSKPLSCKAATAFLKEKGVNDVPYTSKDHHLVLAVLE